MTSSSASEPEFRGKTLTPVSPRPVHISDPSAIPVLEKQMDQAFNDTATHLAPNQPPPAQPAVLTYPEQALPLPDEASSSSSTFAENGTTVKNGGSSEPNGHGDEEINDDYAMSLDFDEDEETELRESSATASIRVNTDNPVPVIPRRDRTPDSNPNTFPEKAHADYIEGSVSTSANLVAQTSPSSYSQPESTASTAILGELAQPTAPTLAGAQTQDDLAAVVSRAEEATDVIEGGVNIQALLDSLSPSTATVPPGDGLSIPTTGSSTTQSSEPPLGSVQSPSASLPAHANLPPRPPPQEKSITQPGYSPQDDIRSYHPHTKAPVGTSSYPTHQPGSFRPSAHGLPAPVIAAGAPGTTSQPASGLPPPPVATFQQPPPSATKSNHSPTSPGIAQKDKVEGNPPRPSADEDADQGSWGPDLQKVYDDFLHEERAYVSEGQWDRFPPNSRLFIGRFPLLESIFRLISICFAGNLPTEKVSKRDLFQIFHRHGRLAQVSIKQAYGFVQFLDASACHRALQAEQGQMLRGRKMREF